MKNVLVTGPTGLIGNSIIEHLLTKGDDRGDAYAVSALVRDVEKSAKVLPSGVQIKKGDITDPSSLSEAMVNIDLVFHAAGMPEQWVTDIDIFDRVNRIGTRNVFEAAYSRGVKRVVYTSTMDVFEKDSNGILTEGKFDPNPKPTAYERSKQAAEREAIPYQDKGLEIVFMNPSAVYGPSHVLGTLNLFLLQLLNGKVPLLPPGGMSVAYIDEVAKAHITAAKRASNGDRFLLADGHFSVKEIALLFSDVAKRNHVPYSAPLWLLKCVAAFSKPVSKIFKVKPLVSKGELAFLTWNAKVDAAKAKRMLGYVQTDFKIGLEKTLPFLKAYKAL